jgi:hypothetical protein
MIISINQPAYIPWLGYFERIYSSDLHIVLNHVQFEKNSFINRNKILTKQGPKWLTIPTTYADQIKSINKCKTINNKKWINVHLKSLYQNYSKANYFKMYFQKIEKILLENINQDNLFQIINTLNLYFFEELEIKTKIIYSDKLNITSKKSDLVFDICKHFNSDIYLSGINGRDYLEKEKFDKHRIEVLFQNYQNPQYSQLGNDFKPNLSILDLLFNEGKNSLSIIKQGSKYSK